MNHVTHNDLLWLSLMTPYDVFQPWVCNMACDGNFDYADGPLDAPIP